MIDITKQWPHGLWSMAGTEGTFEYTVLAASPRGRVGKRLLGGGMVRVRLETAPNLTSKMLARFESVLSTTRGWKHPDSSQRRFSIVIEEDGAGDTVDKLKRLLGQGKLKGFTLAPEPANSSSEPVSTEAAEAVDD